MNEIRREYNAEIIRRMLKNCRGDQYPYGSSLFAAKNCKKFVNRHPNGVFGCSDFKLIKCIIETYTMVCFGLRKAFGHHLIKLKFGQSVQRMDKGSVKSI